MKVASVNKFVLERPMSGLVVKSSVKAGPPIRVIPTDA